MNLTDEQLQSLMQQSAERERKARRTATALTLIPVVFAAIFLGFTLWNIYTAQQRLAITKTDLTAAEVSLVQATRTLQAAGAQIAASNQNISAAQVQLATAEADLKVKNDLLIQSDRRLKENQLAIATLQVNLDAKQKEFDDLASQVNLASRFKVVGDYYSWQITLKEMVNYFYRVYGNNPEATTTGTNLLTSIDRLYEQLPPFNGRGTNPKEGFTSPSFAAYVLQEIKRLPPSRSPILTVSDLRAYLVSNGVHPRRGNQPKPGDLILYKDGFAMFYFQNEQNLPFVIGMTVTSVKQFEPNFNAIQDVYAILP